MSSTLRREYLAALGLEFWVARLPGTGGAIGAAPAGAPDLSEAPVSAAPPASRAAAKPLVGGSTALAAAGESEPSGEGVVKVALEPPVAIPAVTVPPATLPLADMPPSTAGGGRVPPAFATTPVEAAPAAAMAPPADVPGAVPTRRRAPPVPAAAAPPRPGADRESSYDWEQLRERVGACTRCGLAATRTQTVFGVGNRQAAWLVVGEAPGAEEDRQGEPFVGRAGQLLNSMLRAIGLTREQVYIANMLKCRPPNNRDPAAGEVAECSPFLERQVQLLKPKIMLVVGRIAAQNLLQTASPLGRLRQQVHVYGASQVPLVVTYHPAYLLRTPTDKRKAWEDLQFAREVSTRG